MFEFAHVRKREEALSSCLSFAFPQPTDLTVTYLLGEVLRSDSECFTKDKDGTRKEFQQLSVVF